MRGYFESSMNLVTSSLTSTVLYDAERSLPPQVDSCPIASPQAYEEPSENTAVSAKERYMIVSIGYLEFLPKDAFCLKHRFPQLLNLG